MPTVLISKILGILPHEWPRVAVSWAISIFARIGYIVGWTTITAIFVYKMGIENLPILYISYAAFTIIGTLIYSGFSHYLSKELNIVISIIAGSIMIFLANSYSTGNDLLFFTIALGAAGIFFAQLSINISVFVEEVFSPLESQRTFPIIESADTIGGIIGGIIVITLVKFIQPHNLLYIWIISAIAIIPVILIYNFKSQTVPVFAPEDEVSENSLKKLVNGIKEINKIPFLKGLFFIVILHWIFISLLDFQFTKALDQSIINNREHTLVLNVADTTMQANSIIDTKEFLTETNEKNTNREQSREVAYTEKLTEGLGKLYVLISLSALLIQLFLAGRLIRNLGIIGSLILHPIVALINIVGLTLRFDLVTAIISKTGSEITGVIFKNSYNSSYYAISRHKRHQTKEFMEGIGKPFGTILGTVALFLLIRLYQNQILTLSINVSLIFVMSLMLITMLAMQNRYTFISKLQLLKQGEDPERLQAIEILSQKGHKKAGEILTKILTNPAETEKMKVKTLEALGNIQDKDTIPEIIETLLGGNLNLKLAALQTLSKFNNLDKHFLSQAVSHYRIIDTLKKLFKEGNSPELKSEIIKLFAQLNQRDLIPYIFESINITQGKVKASCINALKSFDDISAAYSIKKYQRDKSPEVQIAVVSLMWKFPKLRDQVRKTIERLRKSANENDQILSINMIGRIDIKKYTPFLREQAESKIKKISDAAVFSLAIMAENDAITSIFKSKIKNINFQSLKKYLGQIPENIRPKIEKEFKKLICEEINLIHSQNQNRKLSELDLKILKQLREYYELSGAYDEVYRINNILSSKNK